MDPDSPWYSEVQAAYQRAASGLERGILRDGVITDAEYREVIEVRRSCFRDLGVEFEPDEGTFGGFTIHGDESMTREELDAAGRQCESVGRDIETIYFSMRKNPENEYFPDLIVECLKELGLVPEDLTGDEWMASDQSSVPVTPESDLCFIDPKGLLQ